MTFRPSPVHPLVAPSSVPAGTCEVFSAELVVERLEELLMELSDLGAREEKQFLFIGSRLSDFRDRARRVAAQTEATLEQLAGSEGTVVLEELSSLFVELDDHLRWVNRQSRANARSLQSLESLLRQLERPLHGLAKVVKVLLALSFATRVEGNQRREAESLGVLADNLKDLAAKIATKTERVRDMLETMTRLELEASDRVQQLQGEELERALVVIHQGRLNVEALLERQRMIVSQTGRLQFHSAEIARTVDEIVVSIQFHDITRQQMDHVRAALDELGQELLRRLASGAGAVATAPPLVTEACRLQSNQLEHTRGELVDAVKLILENLDGLADSVKGLAFETRELATSAEVGGTSYYAGLEPVVVAVADVLSQSERINDEAVGAVDAVLRAVEELNQVLGEIEGLGGEMKLIAFNAGITAAHKMQGGAGLGVIADSIQQLSAQVLGRTAEFARSYQSISQEVHELSARSAIRHQGDETDRQVLYRRAVGQLEQLRRAERRLMELLGSVGEGATLLADDIRNTSASISVHIDAAQIIGMVVDALKSLQARCVRFGGEGPGGEVNPLLQRFDRNYTMRSERDVHRKSTGGTGAAGRDGTMPGARRGSEFGENVELF